MADVYGRDQKCFRDYRAAPFSFHYRHCIHPSFDFADSLPPFRDILKELDFCALNSDVPNDQISHVAQAEAYLEHSSTIEDQGFPAVTDWAAVLKKLKLPLEEIGLASDPLLDYLVQQREVVRKRNLSLWDTWLPLAKVNPARDEALTFPVICERVRSLLLLEIAQERIQAESGVESLLEADPTSACRSWTLQYPHVSVTLGLTSGPPPRALC